MKYIPDWNGQNLKSSDMGLLGFFTSSISGYYGVLVESMYRECKKHGYGMEIFILEDEDLFRFLMGKRVDGAPEYTSARQSWPYDKPYYLILNIAVGGLGGR